MNSAGEHQMCRFGQASEGVGPARRIWRKTHARDGDEPTAVRETRQRRANVPRRRFRAAAIDIHHSRERRVHQDHPRADASAQMIVDLRSVERGDRTSRKKEEQKAGAGVGQFVQCKASACDLREDRQKAGPGQRLEDQVTGRDLCCDDRRKPHGQRRRKLLEAFHLFRPAGMGCQQV